ncbi:transposase [Tolypothrix sp. FACHB-123]|nr:transposase [Tolypothrix sp. FACHB-123]
MPDILSLLQCLLPQINATTMRQFNQIILAMLAMSGRVTMLGISRWAGTGGSYRTILRFFHKVIPWATLFWLFFRKHLFRANEVYLLAGDEVVISKSGKKTHDLLANFRLLNPDSGIIDLKAHYRGFRYVNEVLKMLPEIPEPILLNQIFAKLTSLGRIHNVSTSVELS